MNSGEFWSKWNEMRWVNFRASNTKSANSRSRRILERRRTTTRKDSWKCSQTSRLTECWEYTLLERWGNEDRNSKEIKIPFAECRWNDCWSDTRAGIWRLCRRRRPSLSSSSGTNIRNSFQNYQTICRENNALSEKCHSLSFNWHIFLQIEIWKTFMEIKFQEKY